MVWRLITNCVYRLYMLVCYIWIQSFMALYVILYQYILRYSIFSGKCVRVCECVPSEILRERRRSEEEVSRWRADGEPTGSEGSMVSSCCVGSRTGFTSLYSHSQQVLCVHVRVSYFSPALNSLFFLNFSDYIIANWISQSFPQCLTVEAPRLK